METNINYTVVGAFVIALLAVITLSVIWLSAGFSVEQYQTYEVFMRESVNGLAVDASVEFNGVTVGSVKSIEISHKDPQVVILLLNVKSNTPITRGTRATLNMKGLTGIGYLALIDKGTDTRPLEALSDESYPVINTAPSLLVRFDTAMTKLNDSLHQVSVSIRALLDQQNLYAIKKILQNMQVTTESLPQLLQTSSHAMINLDKITQNLASVSDEIKQNPAVLVRGVQLQPLGPGEK